jgi:hypothetical protein
MIFHIKNERKNIFKIAFLLKKRKTEKLFLFLFSVLSMRAEKEGKKKKREESKKRKEI